MSVQTTPNLSNVVDDTSPELGGNLDALANDILHVDSVFGSTVSLPVRIGDSSTTSHGLVSEDDLLITGKLEVDGVSFYDSIASFGATISPASNVFLASNSTLYGGIQTRNTFQTNNGPILATGTTGNYWLIIESLDVSFDFAHSAQTNPTLIGHSANQSTTEWWAITHDQTNAVISVGEGAIITESVTIGITASTTQSQGNGVLTTNINQVSTVANANDVVTLLAAAAGLRVTIINDGANTLQIFPASGDNLGAGVDTSTTLGTGSTATFVAYDSTNWEFI